MRRAAIEPSFESWRDAARALLAERVAPSEIAFDDGSQAVLLPDWRPAAESERKVALPRAFVEDARRAALHRDPRRWDLLYRLAYRLLHENRHLMDVIVDDDVHRLAELDRAVRRDVHKMHAFVRFRQVGDRYIAWYRPDYAVLELAAPFFAERFRTMQWSILTPEASAHWDGAEVRFGPGVPRAEAPSEDELESLWRTYYAAVFNPARTNLTKMRADMPSRFWRDLPELRELPRLLAAAPSRVGSMIETQKLAPSAAPFVPADASLEELRIAARGCEGCDLYEPATQTVFGEGPLDARLVVIGEQPGDQEDRQGRPFVGPAGAVFDEALVAAGLSREQLYVTNAVKHFAYIERGKARIHRQPRTIEVAACRPWLDAELRLLDPSLIVALGATAARALLGARFRVTRDHGRVFTTRDGRQVLATIHPSAILRADEPLRGQYYGMLVRDLRTAAAELTTAIRQ